ncbi:MAG: adenylate/guanylate cyclase domain-containing protein [Syntrophobacterales bacterium]
MALGGETREVTILMSDLRGFTALTADMTPEGIIALLNRYLEKMIEILVDYRAVIDEIQGDGILAFFGAPELLPDHPARAIACAVAMQAAMEEINAKNALEGLPHLEMGIGISSGEVVVGNIGSELRTKYSVVGSPVNFTSRIEAMATAGQVLIGAVTYGRVQDLVDTGEVLHVSMKGIPGQVTLYEVRGLGPPYNLRLKERQEALLPLPERLAVSMERIRDKVVVATMASATLTHLSETGAVALFKGELAEWEDVRLHLLDPAGQQLPGRIYGKVTALEPGPDDLQQATLRFTSVAPDAHLHIRQATGRA